MADTGRSVDKLLLNVVSGNINYGGLSRGQ